LFVVPGPDHLTLAMPMTNVWRYLNLCCGASYPFFEPWMRADYDDSAWPVGLGLLGETTALTPEPIHTRLEPNFLGEFEAVLFRTTWQLGVTNQRVHLVVSNLLDDGAVFYFNGIEKQRLRILPGEIDSFTWADPAPLNGTGYDTFLLRDLDVVPGTNLLAVDVRQALFSRDVVLGVSLHAFPVSDDEPVRVVGQPGNQFVAEGFPARLECAAFGSAPIRYQWYHGGQPVAGATNRTLVVPSMAPENEGMYWVTVENAS
jgi:hypothetical protein